MALLGLQRRRERKREKEKERRGDQEEERGKEEGRKGETFKYMVKTIALYHMTLKGNMPNFR